jgi:hypothetical protein
VSAHCWERTSLINPCIRKLRCPIPRRTRKQLIEAIYGNEDVARLDREEEYRFLARELRWQRRRASQAQANGSPDLGLKEGCSAQEDITMTVL